jgi:hypothetical protein
MMVCLLDAHRERSQELRYEIPPMTIPAIPTRTYLDTFGNTVAKIADARGCPERANSARHISH